MKTISLKLPEALHERLLKIAKHQKLSKSDVLRAAIESYLMQSNGHKRLTVDDLIGDLAGCVEGGPSDLASNPEHLEGFGR